MLKMSPSHGRKNSVGTQLVCVRHDWGWGFGDNRLENLYGSLEVLVDSDELLQCAALKDSYGESGSENFSIVGECLRVLHVALNDFAIGGGDSSLYVLCHSFLDLRKLGDSVVEGSLFDAQLITGGFHSFACAQEVNYVESPFLFYKNCNCVVRHSGGHYSRNGE